MTDFFSSIRGSSLFGGSLTSQQVVGIQSILMATKAARWIDTWTAYLLATAYHETGTHMVAVNEFGSVSYFNDRYGPKSAVGRRMGNVNAGDGNLFHGRGIIQITGRDNYARIGRAIGVDLIAHPEMALLDHVSVDIAVRGMAGGWFTGRKLSDYLTATSTLPQYTAARAIINGQDKAEEIAQQAVIFHNALNMNGSSNVAS